MKKHTIFKNLLELTDLIKSKKNSLFKSKLLKTAKETDVDFVDFAVKTLIKTCVETLNFAAIDIITSIINPDQKEVNQYLRSRSLLIPTQVLTKSDFLFLGPEIVDGEGYEACDDFGYQYWVGERFFPLMAYYYWQKDKTPTPYPFFRIGNYEKSVDFVEMIRLLDISEDGTNFVLWFQDADHYCCLKCEKIDGHNHIIILDNTGIISKGDDADFNYRDSFSIETLLPLLSPVILKRTISYYNNETVNTERFGVNCIFYSIKIGRQLSKSPSLAIELRSRITQTIQHKSGFTQCLYNIPARFWVSARSPDKVADFLHKNAQEADLKIYGSQKTNLGDFIYKSRTIHAYNHQSQQFKEFNSLITVPNRHYAPGNGHPQFTYKNAYIDYFRMKYLLAINHYLGKLPYNEVIDIVLMFSPRFLPLLLYQQKFLKDLAVIKNPWVYESLREGKSLKFYSEDKDLQTRLSKLFRLLLPNSLFPKLKESSPRARLKNPPRLVCKSVDWFDQGFFSGEPLSTEPAAPQAIPESKKPPQPVSPQPTRKRQFDLIAERERIRKRSEEDLHQEKIYQARLKRNRQDDGVCRRSHCER